MSRRRPAEAFAECLRAATTPFSPAIEYDEIEYGELPVLALCALPCQRRSTRPADFMDNCCYPWSFVGSCGRSQP